MLLCIVIVCPPGVVIASMCYEYVVKNLLITAEDRQQPANVIMKNKSKGKVFDTKAW